MDRSRSFVKCSLSEPNEHGIKRLNVTYRLFDDDVDQELVVHLAAIIRLHCMDFRRTPDEIMDKLNAYVNSNDIVANGVKT